MEFKSQEKTTVGKNGLAQADILTFSKNVINSLIKELAQNSIDAKDNKKDKVELKIDLQEIERTEIDNLDSLAEIFDNCLEYTSKDHEKEFFEKGREIIKADKIKIFSFCDYNTNGLSKDEGTLDALIFDEGNSQKQGSSSLGGFGIGKNSIFGITQLQTVFYSSLNPKGESCFIGLSKLCTYKDSNDDSKVNRVYYADWNGNNFKYIDDTKKIPKRFRRDKPGLSTYALGISNEKDWETHVCKGLIKNYWHLFEKNKISVEVSDKLIDNSSYYEIAKQLFTDEEDASTLAYIETFKNPKHSATLKIHEIGDVEILLNEEPENSLYKYPNKIAFIRDGMLIKEYRAGVNGLPSKIAGIMYAKTEAGNLILSKMEPPQHNDFQKEILNKKIAHLTEDDGEKIVNEIEDKKTEFVRSLKDQYNKPTKNVDFVDELLSGLVSSAGNGGGSTGKKTKSKEETFDVGIKETKLTAKLYSGRKSIVEKKDEEGDIESGGGKTEYVDGEGGKGPSNGSGTGDGRGGQGTVRRKRKKRNLKSKLIFSHTKNSKNHYKLIIYTDKEIKNYNLKFTQHGDGSGKVLSTNLKEVSYHSGTLKFIEHNNYYEIIGLNLKEQVRNVFDLVFEENFQSAFKIIT